MNDPSWLLQAAIVPRLKQTAALATLIGDRVYDEVPAVATFPYVTVGGGQVTGDDVDCAAISEVFFQIHAWARSPSARAAVKRIAAAIRDAMAAPIALAGFDVQIQDYQQTQWLDDPDGLTQHAMVEFRFIIITT
jgi:hypothetical protein